MVVYFFFSFSLSGWHPIVSHSVVGVCCWWSMLSHVTMTLILLPPLKWTRAREYHLYGGWYLLWLTLLRTLLMGVMANRLAEPTAGKKYRHLSWVLSCPLRGLRRVWGFEHSFISSAQLENEPTLISFFLIYISPGCWQQNIYRYTYQLYRYTYQRKVILVSMYKRNYLLVTSTCTCTFDGQTCHIW